jgi:hypothetical protein
MTQKIIFLIVIISSCSFSQNQISLIPETIKIDDYFVLQPDTIRVKDINNDFQKEILRKNRIPQCKIDSIKTLCANKDVASSWRDKWSIHDQSRSEF